MRVHVPLLLLVFWPLLSSAQGQPDTTLLFEFQLRVRSEWRDGYQLASTSEDRGSLSTFQRNRIGFSGGWGRMAFRIQFQDVRNYGQPSGNTQGNIGAAEAWGSLVLRDGIKAVVGRQKIDIDNGRIVGAANWANPGRFLDGILLIREREKNRTSAMAAWDEINQTRRLFVHHTQPFGARHKLTLLAYDQESNTEFSAFTTGLTWTSKMGDSGWWATEAYLQKPDGGGSGAMWTLEGGRTGPSGHTWVAGLDLLTDEGAGAAFSPLLGTNHKFYGWMDHFYLGAATNGLTDLHIRHLGPISESCSWGAVFHHFRAFGFRGLLAQELDMYLTGFSQEGLSWTVGWSLMNCTPEHVNRQGHLSETDASQSAEHLQQWGWVSLNIEPSVLLK